MREPWPKGPTYEITEDGYRGLLYIQPEQLRMVVEEGAKRNWQMTAHTAGEGAMDELLDAYEFVNRETPIKRPALLHHARQLPVAAQPGALQDARRLRRRAAGLAVEGRRHAAKGAWRRSACAGSQPYKRWMEYTTIGGGSDHMVKLDSLEATNPWNPWLGDLGRRWTRQTEARRRLDPGRAADARTGHAAVHHQQCVSEPRGEG